MSGYARSVSVVLTLALVLVWVIYELSLLRGGGGDSNPAERYSSDEILPGESYRGTEWY